MEPNKWLDNCINNSFKADYVSHHVFIFSSSLALSFVTVCASWITWVAKKRLKMQKTQSAQHVWFSSCSGVNSQSNRFLTGVHLQVTQTPSIRRSWTWVWLLCSHLAKDSQWAREPTRVGFKWNEHCTCESIQRCFVGRPHLLHITNMKEMVSAMYLLAQTSRLTDSSRST